MNKSEVHSERRRFVLVILPWIVAAAALLVYLATLDHWVSLNSLLAVAKLSGWTWQPELTGPLYWALTFPLRWLPPQTIPVAVNLFSTACAVLTLALLARSVALLPHNRTQDQREREKSEFSLLSIRGAWLPPVLAAVVLGLQLTFWEDATSGSGQMADLATTPFANHCEMLDLLLFAYVLRCLLEFRVSDRQSWMSRAAFVYGLGMTSNWAMTALLPLFAIAVIRFKGLSFFNTRFLVRTTLWGLAGLSFFFLLPAVQSQADISRVPFWGALTASLGFQKATLASIHAYFTFAKEQALLLTVTSLVPIFLIGLRWSPAFGDSSRAGVWLTTLTFQAVQAVLLAACVWLALDPKLSPRNSGFSMPCFTVFYLGALSVGYFSGYFLLVHGRPARGSRKPFSPTLVNRAVVWAVWLLLPIVPALLVWRNLPQMRLTNGPMLKQFAALQAEALPPQGAVLLSDDPRPLSLLHSYLAGTGKGQEYVFVDTASLQMPEYHRFLRKQYSDRWPVTMPRNAQQLVSQTSLMRLAVALALSNQVYYLHPSFGYYFEVFDAEPHGLVYKLTRCSTNSLLAARPAKGLLEANESFWTRTDHAILEPLAAALFTHAQPASEGWMHRLAERAYLKEMRNRDATVLASFYSRALDYWGVQEQKAGHLKAAAVRFQRALDLNPQNLVAKVNLDCNRGLGANPTGVRLPGKSVEELFGQVRNWDLALSQNGPFDQPICCYEQGLAFAKGRLYRQAAQEFARAKALLPDDLSPALWLARMDILRALPEEALLVLQEIHERTPKVEVTRTNLTDLLLVETAAYLTKGDVKGAEGAVRWALDKYPGDEALWATAARVYQSYGILSNAVTCVQAALKKAPDDENLLVMASQVYMSANLYTNAVAVIGAALDKHTADDLAKQFLLATAAQIDINAGSFSNAVAHIDRQLKLNPNNPQALVSKGYACLQLGALDQAANLLTQAMDMETNNTPDLRTYARLNRAVTYLRADKLDLAQRDYETLKKSFPAAYPVYYGLQEIAYRKKDTNTAVLNCQLYLTNAPPDTYEHQLISNRLQELRPAPR
ncbi:MAG TPA: tetratricopeptide repeat protein [Dongiaceae bacterium]|nr:tetratricopeptide repeat protein [Dongiaceae bacterium]